MNEDWFGHLCQNCDNGFDTFYYEDGGKDKSHSFHVSRDQLHQLASMMAAYASRPASAAAATTATQAAPEPERARPRRRRARVPVLAQRELLAAAL